MEVRRLLSEVKECMLLRVARWGGRLFLIEESSEGS